MKTIFNKAKCEVKQVVEFINRQNNNWSTAKKGVEEDDILPNYPKTIQWEIGRGKE